MGVWMLVVDVLAMFDLGDDGAMLGSDIAPFLSEDLKRGLAR